MFIVPITVGTYQHCSIDGTQSLLMCCNTLAEDVASQVMHSPYNGVRHCVTRMLAEEGIGAFYKSYKITVRLSKYLK